MSLHAQLEPIKRPQHEVSRRAHSCVACLRLGNHRLTMRPREARELGAWVVMNGCVLSSVRGGAAI